MEVEVVFGFGGSEVELEQAEHTASQGSPGRMHAKICGVIV
jgi:hypothetical protein